MKFKMEIPLQEGTTLGDVLDALTQSKEGIIDGNDPLEVGDSGYATVTTDYVGRWIITD